MFYPTLAITRLQLQGNVHEGNIIMGEGGIITETRQKNA
jgi:hypothetical protein